MRIKEDETYPEMKERIKRDFFDYMDEEDSAEDITDWIGEDLNYLFKGTSGDLRMLAIGVEEIKRGILEERVLAQISMIIAHYEAGRYDADLWNIDNERNVVKEDIEFIKENVEIIPPEDLLEFIFDKNGNIIGEKPFVP